ncbi:exopolysaccharide Pel transporter PelG [Ruminococcus sp.]|uniref:exopolysaccharide Pel transporter PelG n=1 Tax=Ruminococcus sp. TaxID=41978 RepID=UPI002E7A94A6|nr:exopolysaccharide Pel transporter PelG [Ruminococcus sp.]MEE1262109.1 exopolysaccharide Pel transporter PelG [Ruminococcus sp.]
MAGVGFELRKAVTGENKGEKITGYFGASFSSSGSMIVAIVIFALVQAAAKAQQVSQAVNDSFMCYITNAMFLSILLSSLLSPVLSRYVSDAVYLGKTERVMPSMVGGSASVAVTGGILFSVQLLLSGTEIMVVIPLFILFLALCVCWILMTYITLIRDYKKIVIAYLAAFGVSAAALALLFAFTTLSVPAMILVLLLAFATVDVLLFRSVYLTFAKHDNSVFAFRSTIKTNPSLLLIGFLMAAGMLGHFWLTWFLSDSSTQISLLFRFNAKYDFPAIAAYFSTIPAAVYFITSFETGFSKKYSNYFSALQSATARCVEAAKDDMVLTLRKKLKTMFLIQLVSCLLFVTVGSKLLGIMNIGMTESMLSAFRMFCVGYSLYYIGSTLILIRLWFSDERRAVFTAAFFAAGVLAGTYLGILFFPRFSGAAFTAVSIVMTLFAAAGLIRRLKKLEFYLLCRGQYDEPVNIPRTARSKTVSKKRLIHLSAAAAMAAVTVLGSVAFLIGDAVYKSKIITFSPESSNDVILSPGMGLAPWADSDETPSMNTSLVYVELKWSDWEPEDDVFDVDYVNEHFNLELYREEGRQVVFRFVCDEPREEPHMDIPEWLYQLTGDGEMYDINYGRGYSPNYENEIFVSEHAEAIAALGEAFGQDDFFVYVELGSLGHWGEWHVDYEAGLKPMPLYEVREQYVMPYLNAFPNARFLLRYPLVDAKQNSTGLYNDLTGDYDETLYWINQMTDSEWEQTGAIEQADCSDNWKSQPIGGEFAQTHENSYFMRTEFDMTLEAIRMSHQSFIGPKIIIDEDDSNFSYQMDEILKTLGYRYRVDKVSMNFAEKESFNISCNIVNDGIAPIYDSGCKVRLDIYDPEGTLVRSITDADVELTNVIPGEGGSFSVSVDKEDFDDDTEYTLTVSAETANGKLLPMAMKDEYKTNVYTAAKFHVE